MVVSATTPAIASKRMARFLLELKVVVDMVTASLEQKKVMPS